LDSYPNRHSPIDSADEALKELNSLDSLASQSIVSFPFRHAYFKHIIHQTFNYFGITESAPLPSYPLFFVTIASQRDRKRYPTFFNTPLRPIDFQAMDRVAHSILRGLHYVGFADTGAYLYTGYELQTYRELSPHHHLVVWGCSKESLKERLRAMRIKHRISCKFRTIRHKRISKFSRQDRRFHPHQLSLGRVFSYCHKFVCKEVVKGSRRKESVDRHGVVHPIGELYEYERQIPGNKTRIVIYRWLKDVPLFNFLISGGDGVRLVKAAKKGCLRELRPAKKRESLCPKDAPLSNFVGHHLNAVPVNSQVNVGESPDETLQPAPLLQSSSR